MIATHDHILVAQAAFSHSRGLAHFFRSAAPRFIRTAAALGHMALRAALALPHVLRLVLLSWLASAALAFSSPRE